MAGLACFGLTLA